MGLARGGHPCEEERTRVDPHPGVVENAYGSSSEKLDEELEPIQKSCSPSTRAKVEHGV